MSTIKIAPSILSADFSRLGEEVSEVLRCGADYIHFDVIDGSFAPNITIGIPVLKSLRKAFPDIFIDVHLMIRRPERYVDAFVDAGASLLMFHVEADEPQNISAAIRRAHARGVKAGLAVKPKTPAEVLLPWLVDLDMVLVMTVEPGFSGQRFMDDQINKIDRVRKLLDQCSPYCDLEVDGGITPETAPLVIAAGANVLVTGNAVFQCPDRAEAVRLLRNGK